jgi:hypothetical protein
MLTGYCCISGSFFRDQVLVDVIDSWLSWIAQQRQPQEGAFRRIFGHKQSRRATTTSLVAVVLGRLDEFIVGVGFADG